MKVHFALNLIHSCVNISFPVISSKFIALLNYLV